MSAIACSLGCGRSGGAADGSSQGNTNVLLISLDSTRRDYLSAYGHRAPHAPAMASTPCIDALAEQGVLFEDAYSTTSWTLPSHCAILTGQPDLVHAVELEIYKLDGTHATLAETLRDAGYRTAGFFSGPHLEPRFGFDRGFERYVECYGEQLRRSSANARVHAGLLEEQEQGGMSAELVAAFNANVEAQRELEVAAQGDVSSMSVADAAISEIEEAASGERPFFIFAHFFDPHFDYTPPHPFRERFDPEYSGDIDGDAFFRNPAIARVDESRPSGRVRVVSERDLEHLQALYAGDLSWTDAQVGRILDVLSDHGLAQNTLVVIVADHGDEFFEHDGIGHRRTLFEEVVQVPMILRLPEVLPAGTRVPGPVSTADLFPTVLDLIQVPLTSDTCSRSLVDQVLDPTGTVLPGVMGRLVRTQSVRVQTTIGDEQVVTPVDRVSVIETFRIGAIKITRQRDWLKPPAGSAAAVHESIQNLSRQMYSDERLVWIDIESAPDEQEQDHSTDFSDPRAGSALTSFRTAYSRLVAGRSTAGLEEASGVMDGALSGLGYAEALELGGTVDLGEFVLPPPGEALIKDH